MSLPLVTWAVLQCLILLYGHFDLLAPVGAHSPGHRGHGRGFKKSAVGSQQVRSEDEIAERCAGTTGTWCRDFYNQKPIPSKAPPRGNKTCLNRCNNGAGVCNHDTGICDCMAGFTGDYCQDNLKRPCTLHPRIERFEHGYTASRCSGYCDDTIAACFCGQGKYAHIPADPDSAPGTPPRQMGRTTALHCAINEFPNGTKLKFEGVPWEALYGKDGWCEADFPKHKCLCLLDGMLGPYCMTPTEQFCLNQCSGKGECHLGFCRCLPGYYGHDCARRRADAPELPGLELERPWLREVLVPPPGAQDPPPQPTRLRPLIYIYDLPAKYNTRMLEYRIDRARCVHRMWDVGNETASSEDIYMVEPLLHEALLQSPHRTLDPDEADFFYVPLYTTCFIYPVFGWADYPWFYGPGSFRVNQAAMMALEAKRWLETHLPYWNRRGGRDHVWLFAHDEGSCWVPQEIWEASIILSSWGRTDEHPKSGTSFWMDNYSYPAITRWNPDGFTDVIGDHPCFDPKRHLLVPAVLSPQKVGRTPLFGEEPKPRTTLLYFRGGFRAAEAATVYSRGTRQRLRELAQKHRWDQKYKILIGTGKELPGRYDDHLMTSKFCLVVPGDGWSPRAEVSILHGCVPLVIMDDVDPVLGNAIDWSAFSVRMAQADLESVPEVLSAITEEELRAKQIALSKVWKRFIYSSYSWYGKLLKKYTATELGRAVDENPDPHSVPRLNFTFESERLQRARRLHAAGAKGDSDDLVPDVKEERASAARTLKRDRKRRWAVKPSHTPARQTEDRGLQTDPKSPSSEPARNIEAQNDEPEATSGSGDRVYASLPEPYRGDITTDDAIDTILGWLYGKLLEREEEEEGEGKKREERASGGTSVQEQLADTGGREEEEGKKTEERASGGTSVQEQLPDAGAIEEPPHPPKPQPPRSWLGFGTN